MYSIQPMKIQFQRLEYIFTIVQVHIVQMFDKIITDALTVEIQLDYKQIYRLTFLFVYKTFFQCIEFLLNIMKRNAIILLYSTLQLGAYNNYSCNTFSSESVFPLFNHRMSSQQQALILLGHWRLEGSILDKSY